MEISIRKWTLLGVAVLAAAGACSSTPSTKVAGEVETRPTVESTTTATEATTTTTDPRVAAVAAWAVKAVPKLQAVQGALTRISDSANAAANAASDSVDNYLADPNKADVIGDSNRVTAALEQEKRVCAAAIPVIKAAQQALPAPDSSINAPLSSALDHYLNAARDCGLGEIEKSTSEVRAGGADLSIASSAIDALKGG